MSEQAGDPFARASLAGAGAAPRRYGEVGTDMESIFGQARVVGTSDAPSYALPVAKPARRRGGRVLGGVTLAALAAVAGVAMGVTVLDGSEPDARAAAIRAQPSVRPSPVVTQTVPQANLAVATIAVARPVETIPDAAPVVVATPTMRTAAVDRIPSIAAPRVRPDAETGRNSVCDGRRGPASFACLAEELDGADRELVDAYASAAEAGVSRGHLVAINRRWVRARDRAQDDPAETLQSYEDMAGELWAARRRALASDE